MSFRTRSLAHGGVTGSFSKTLGGSETLRLRDRVAVVAPQPETHIGMAAILRTALQALLGFAIGGSLALMLFNNWTPEMTGRHIAAAWNCQTAQSVGLAPAHRGQPGYWPWLDTNSDGVACEASRTAGTRASRK
jgi:hypothetical protein